MHRWGRGRCTCATAVRCVAVGGMGTAGTLAGPLAAPRRWSASRGPAGLMDVGCTYRAIRREALERIMPDLVVGGDHFSLHMLLVAMARGLSVVEIPIRFRRRVGQSKGASQSLWKGLEVGLVMIWHIMTFSLPPAPHVVAASRTAGADQTDAGTAIALPRCSLAPIWRAFAAGDVNTEEQVTTRAKED